MNLAIEHNEVEDNEITFEACGCIYDGLAWERCEDHLEIIEEILTI